MQCRARRSNGCRETPNIETVSGEQGSFTELAMNGGAAGLGDGHPALQDLEVRHAIAHAIDREVLFDRVALGTGSVGTVMVPSADPAWTPELSDDEAFTFDPELANTMLDDAGYLDTDGDGIREMPDGTDPLEFRYVERSESDVAPAIREFVTQWLSDIGIGTEVSVMDDDQLYEASIAGEYDLFVWGWTPFVDPDPAAQLLHLRRADHGCRVARQQRRQLVRPRLRRAVRAAEGRTRPRPSASRSSTRW